MLFKLADNTNRDSLASRLRRERIRKFADLLRNASHEVRILDVGGTPEFWLSHRDELPQNVSLTLLNLDLADKPQYSWVIPLTPDPPILHQVPRMSQNPTEARNETRTSLPSRDRRERYSIVNVVESVDPRVPALTGRGYNPWREPGDSTAGFLVFTRSYRP